MSHFPVRLGGGIALLVQAFLLQFLWTPHNTLVGETPIFTSITISVFMTLLAVLGFVFLRPTGWIVAMLVQTICLLTALFIRFSTSSFQAAAHFTMLYSIGMVLYLNAHAVRSAFERRFQNGHTEEAKL
ncbi:MAG: hypothetical protein KDJ97_22960 [Anaerolineae bacterium]|nr:hypothetical protein [Anaerolineae bacterium]